jgi:hypothetical protein
MTDEKKPDLFTFLAKISVGDHKYVSAISDEDKKSLPPLVVMRWLTGTTDEKQIRYLNHFVNPMVFNLSGHSDLLYKMMMSSCTGSSRKYSWIKRNKKTERSPMAIEVIKAYHSCSTREARSYLPLMTKDNLREMSEALGYDNDQLKKLAKE